MNTAGKLVDATVMVGSAFVIGTSAYQIIKGVSAKSTTAIALSALTLLIGVYAFKEAANK